jgi:hypothetical protein
LNDFIGEGAILLVSLTGIQLERRLNEYELTAVLLVDVGKRNH